MGRGFKVLWKKSIALLLATVLILTDLTAAAAAESRDARVNEETSLLNLMNAVYSAMENADGQPQAAPAPAGLAADDGPSSWNLLSKVDRSLVGTIYHPDNPKLKLSADGRYIAFERYEVIPEPVTVKPSIGVYDRVTGVIDSVYAAGQTDDIISFDISSDARYVAFSMEKDILLMQPSTYVFLLDRQTGNINTITTIPGDNDSYDGADSVSISADGRYVAFDSVADGLVPEDTDGVRDVFVYDRDTGALQRISTRAGMEDFDYGDSKAPSISADGRYVAFQTQARLVDDDSTTFEDIYLYDRTGGSLQRISVDLNGQESSGHSSRPSISADGQLVAFVSGADNLVAADPNERNDIFVYDRRTSTTSLVSVGPGGIPFNRDSENPSISADGQFVGFQLAYEYVTDTDDDLDNDDENDLPEEAYVANVATHTAERVTVQNAPYRMINPSQGPVVGRGGALVALFSTHVVTVGEEQEEYELPGIFLATRGTAPVWPAGSVLQPSNETAESVTLSWSDASDAKGILGYQVLRDGTPIGFVPFTGAGGSYVATGFVPGAEHLFQVEAVNADYIDSYGGPTYKLGKGGGDPGSTLRIAWEAEKSRYGLPMAGSKLSFTAYGAPGKQVTGELTYKAWKDATTQETHKIPLAFNERATAPGKYDVEWNMVEGASELTSLSVKLTDPAKPGSAIEQQAAGFPVQVTGTAVISFDNPGGGSLKNGILSLLNSQYGEQITVLNGEGPVTVEGIVPGKDYTIVLRSPDFRYVWAKLEQFRVDAGRQKPVSLTIEQPAKARFQILDPTGQPEGNTPIGLYDEEQNFLGTHYTNMDGWTDWEEGLKVGSTIVAKVDIGDRMLEKVPNQQLRLAPGNNEKVIKLVAPGEGILEGVVKAPNGKPVPNALVTSTQTFRGMPVVRKARTNLAGGYRMSLLKGEAKLEAYESSYEYSTEGSVTAQVEEGATTKYDIAVRQPSRGVINLEVRLKYLEDGDYGEPVNMEQVGFFTRIESKFGEMTGYFQNAYSFQGSPGEKVSVCVTATKPAYMVVCDEVTLDANANGTAKIFLEEKGGRIQGKLANADNRWVSGTIYKLSPEGYRTSRIYIGDNDFTDVGTFDFNVPEPGTYLMELARWVAGDQKTYEYATVQFTVADKQILPLGTIAFGEKKYFSNYDGNRYDALNSRIIPGGTITLRAGFKNGNLEASDASLVIDIPEGMAPVKDAGGRIVINGAATAGDARVEGSNLIVPLGALAKKQAGTIGFQLKIDPTFNRSTAQSSARIRAKFGAEQVEETIGNIQLDAPVVTLEAPERLFNPLVKLSGIAPIGSAVKVYDNKALIGSAVASATGFWSLEAEIDELGDPSTHALRAEAESGGVKLQSAISFVDYDTKKPRLMEVAMAQAPNGKWVTMNTREGISRLAYTVVPGNPFQFELNFDKPDEVDNVYVYLDGQTGDPVKAVRDGAVFRAVAPTSKGALGDIYVDFDIKPEPFVFDGRQPSLEEIRKSLPLSMRDFEMEVKTPFELRNGKYSGVVQLTFPQLDGLIITQTLTLGPNSTYKATKEEIELAQRSGQPLINATFGVTETADGFKSVSKGYIPTASLFPDGLPKSLAALGATGEVRTLGDGDFPVLTDVSTETYVQFGPGGEEFGTINGIKKQYSDTKGFAEKVMKITDRVQKFGFDCIQELPKTFNQAGHALKSLVVGEVTKFGLGAWTAAMGLSGAGAIAAAGASAVIGQKIDSAVDEQIDAIGTGYNECLKEDVDPKKKKRKKIARPRWIYDPSGYVYEAVPANRLNGVKATVLYKDPVSQEWTVWDAGPYEQVNPHNTDDQGKYGWDVPEGKWKVVWEKEGYETATSAELDVPPPHTEVNAGLVSREAPKVQSVTGVAFDGGSYVDIQLSKYVKVPSSLPAQAVTVIGPNNQEVEGTLAFSNTAVNPADPAGLEQLSPILRFTPKPGTNLTVGATYAIKVNPSFFQSYAGVWMTESYEGQAAVTQRDARGPIPIRAEIEGEGMIVSLTFDEPLGETVDSSKVALNGNAEAIASVARTATRNGNGNNVLLISLNEPVPNGGTAILNLLGGVVNDPAGNGSAGAELAVSRQAVGNNAELSGLSVTGGALSPVFDPQRLAYEVKVTQTAEDIQVTAVTADTKAKLVVDGMEAVSGIARSVRIPDSGTISVRVLAADGKTVREYTLAAKRGTEPVSTDAALSALAVSPGTLTPVFDPSKETYGVEVATDATTLQVTATTRDPKASSLKINGITAASGTAKSVAIPSGGLITVAVTAEDGQTNRAYKIQVTRRQNPGPSSGGGGGGGGSSGSTSVTKTEKYKSDNGGVGLLTTLNGDAITKALQTGADGKKLLYVAEGQQADEYALRLTPDALAALKKSLAGIVYKPGTLQASIPGAVLDKVSLPADASLNITLTALSDAQSQATLDIASKQSGKSLKPVGKAIKIKLETLRDGKTNAFEVPSTQAILVELPIEKPGKQAVYRFDPSTGRWSYVKGQTAAQEPNRIVVGIRSSGHFAVMEYANTFKDIAGHWAAPDIGWMAQRLLANGVTPESFEPNRAVTRAEFTSLLVRALDLPAAGAGKVTRFTDVGESEWYYDNVQSIVAAGIMLGVSDDRYAPNSPITREQMAVLIWRAYAYLHSKNGQDANLEQLRKFKDGGKISAWAKDAVTLSLQEGLMQGTSADSFDPKGQATRAQMAAIVKRLLEHK